MKKLLLGFTLLASMSAFSAQNSSQYSVLEETMEEVFFECSGTEKMFKFLESDVTLDEYNSLVNVDKDLLIMRLNMAGLNPQDWMGYDYVSTQITENVSRLKYVNSIDNKIGAQLYKCLK